MFGSAATLGDNTRNKKNGLWQQRAERGNKLRVRGANYCANTCVPMRISGERFCAHGKVIRHFLGYGAAVFEALILQQRASRVRGAHEHEYAAGMLLTRFD